MNTTLRTGLVGLALAIALAACGKKEEATAPPADTDDAAMAGSGQEEAVLNVYNWSDYIAEDTIDNFEAATGIDVTYDVFDSNEVLETKLLAGTTGYDVVVPSASFMERQIKAGVFQKLDMSQLPNATGLDADIMQRIALHDPGNQYSIPYMWGTTGIGYNEEKVMAIDKKAPVDSWDIVFKPELAKKFKDCGISVLDAPTEVIGAVLAWLGKDPNSQDPADLKAAEDKLMAVRPYIRKIHSSQYIEDLANGDICLAVGWSGDILQARDRADEADQGVVIKYAIPKEGTIIWFDMLAIPADAKHPKNAHAFINYLLDPQVAANNSNYINYANGVAASLDLIDEGVKDDPGIYPSPEVKAKLFPDLAESEEFTRLVNRTWTKFSTGQ
jgi:putrescine transport system substrate-binding protein